MDIDGLHDDWMQLSADVTNKVFFCGKLLHLANFDHKEAGGLARIFADLAGTKH